MEDSLKETTRTKAAFPVQWSCLLWHRSSWGSRWFEWQVGQKYAARFAAEKANAVWGLGVAVVMSVILVKIYLPHCNVISVAVMLIFIHLIMSVLRLIICHEWQSCSWLMIAVLCGSWLWSVLVSNTSFRAVRPYIWPLLFTKCWLRCYDTHVTLYDITFNLIGD